MRICADVHECDLDADCAFFFFALGPRRAGRAAGSVLYDGNLQVFLHRDKFILPP